MFFYRNVITTFLIVFIIAGVLFSCSKSPRCWGKNQNKGIIIESHPIACDVATDQTTFIVMNDSTYLAAFANSVIVCTLPPIDFNKQSLLGFYTLGGCEVKYIREVLQLDSEEKYLYRIIVKNCGSCKRSNYSYNWVTVPRVPDGWTVRFELREK